MVLKHIEIVEINKPVYIAPFSCIGIIAYHLMKKNGITVLGFCDNNLKHTGKKYEGTPIVSPELSCRYNEEAVFIIASDRYRKELADQLRSLGAKDLIDVGQLLTAENYNEVINDINEEAARALGGWGEPKDIANYVADFYFATKPRLDKNLTGVFAFVFDLFFDPYNGFINSFNKKSENFEIYEDIRIYFRDSYDNNELEKMISYLIQIIRYIKATNVICKCINLIMEYSILYAQQFKILNEKLIEAGINVCIMDKSQIALAKSKNLSQLLVSLILEKVYSDVENHFNCIYVHIPKNAGISIINFLQYEGVNYHSHHKFALSCRHANEEKFLRYFKFTIVRNPWDWFVSYYHYLQKEKNLNCYTFDHEELSRSNYICKCKSFKEAVYALEKFPAFDPQYKWICDEDDNIIVDYVGRFENLPESIAYICNKLGFERYKKFPHENASSRKPYQEYYDDEMIEIVRRAYKKDVELFGYEFDKHPGSNMIINPREDFVPNLI